MELDESSKFEILDYCVLVALLFVSVVIGVFASWRGNKSPEEFLMGNRAFGAIPIAMSIQTTYVSALHLLGYSGEAYTNGLQLSLFVVGTGFAIAVAAQLFLPVLYPLKLTSVHEYIELRFNSPRLRTCVTIIVCLQEFFYMGFNLYAPTIALSAVTPISPLTYIFLLGVVCTFYSTIGGMRAVVWTDVMQLSVMIIGLIVIVVAGTIQVGGLGEVWSIADVGGRLNFFNMDPSIYDRPNFYNSIAFGFCYYTATYGITQVNFQRVSSVSTINEAKKALYLNIIGMMIIYFLTFAGGLITYAAYVGCDPLLLGKIHKKEEILSFFVADRLSFIVGLPGLFVATLIGGTLSTLSSIINGQVAIIWKEISPKIKILDEATPKVSALINKIFSLLIGATTIGLAIIASKAGSIIRFSMTAISVVNGPIYGVFFLGILFPKCNLIGVWSGVVSSLGFLLWIAIGSALYIKSQSSLPLSTESCNASVISNLTDKFSEFPSNAYTNQSFISNDQDLTYVTESTNYSSLLMKLYSISFTLYPLLGQAICITVGVIVSYLTGFQKIENVSAKYVSPYIRKFYWREEHQPTSDTHISLEIIKTKPNT